jgi:hypothetical protein
MNKIPVFRTISQSYGFAFGRYLPILGVVWLPLLIMTALGFFIALPAISNFPQMMQDVAQHAQQGAAVPFVPAQFSQSAARLNAVNLVIFLLYAPIAVGVTLEALGLRTGPRFIYVSVGVREILVIAGWIAVAAFVFAVAIALGIIAGIVGVAATLFFAANSGAHTNAWALALTLAPAALVLAFLLALAFSYVLLRMSYLMVPVTAAEKQFGIVRSWQLTKGNFWRIVAIFLATLLPLFVLEGVVIWLALAPAILEMFAQIKAHPQDSSAFVGTFMQGYVHSYLYIWPALLVLSPVIYGLMLGQSAFAYRALVPTTGQAPSN